MWPIYWSSCTWDMLHMIAMSYPENPSKERKTNTISMLKGIMMNLPCPACQIHAMNYLDKTPPDVSSREALGVWLVDFHNVVNKRTGKRSNWTLEECNQEIIRRCLANTEDLKATDLKRQEDHRYISKLLVEKNTNDIVSNITLGFVVIIFIFNFVWIVKRIKNKNY